ncbi:hypothetical protein BDV18DRAFT_161274 [Aspergillus unguis]
MSGPFQRPPFNSSNSSSPLSPHPRGDTPVSFRTNVNRAKTKRWVEAKKYSYDGDDWGEDEYGEYEYDDEPPVPQTHKTGANQSTPDVSSTLSKETSRPPLPSSDRSRSVDRIQTVPTEGPATSDSPTTPIVRPAEIYKRMRDEQQTRQTPPIEPSTEPSSTSPPINSPPAEPSGIAAFVPTQVSEPTHEAQSESVDHSAIPPASANEVPTIALPEVKRLSAFGSSFFPESESNSQSVQDPASQPHQLQHNPSLGFRSAVNQAFDVPETPSTTADSVARSNSDSTTGISPIIARHGTIDDKTPTIHEEPNENGDTPVEGGIAFKPGHRRDLSIPSPGNSPSRQPVIAGPDASASSELAQVSGGSPAESPDHEQSSQIPDPDTPQPSRETPRWDLPAPLNVQTNMASNPAVTNENIPTIIPAMSTETSPADTENDRLRKEIIRSLSRENSPSEHQDTPPQTSGQDNLYPGNYETSKTVPETTIAQDPAPAEAPSIEQPIPIAPQSDKPKLKKRFSWEESSSDDEPTPVPEAQPSRPPPMPGQFPMSQDNVHPDAVVPPVSLSSGTAEPARGLDEPAEDLELTVVPPEALDTLSIQSSEPGHEYPSQTTENLARAEEGKSYSPEPQPLEPSAKVPSASMESGLLGFKDILGIQSPYGRIQAFDKTRDQFGAIDTGLNNWLQVTIHAHPEHTDIIERNSKPLSEEFKNSVPRNKFTKLASLGNLASSLQDGSSGSGHIRRPSAPLGSMRQQSGKDFLHTAGMLGGQAGKAAKGLFSKGRSKFKGAGGSEKPDAEPGPDLEDSQVLHGFPSSRAWASDRSADAEPTRVKSPDKAVVSSTQQAPAAARIPIIPGLLKDKASRMGPIILVARPVRVRLISRALSHEMTLTVQGMQRNTQDSVSSLSVQDPGPLPPVAQKLVITPTAQHCPSKSSSQPRDLGGCDRTAESHGEFKVCERPLTREVIHTSPACHSGRHRSPSPLSPFPPRHEWPRRPEQISSSRDPASQSHRRSSSPMERLMNTGRFRRISMGLNQPDFKPEQSQKKRNRLTSLFTRHQHRKSAPPTSKPIESSSEGSTRYYLAPASSRPDSRLASSSISSFDNPDRPLSLPDARKTFQGRRAPVEGFFAHESPESFAAPKLHPDLCRPASSEHMGSPDPTAVHSITIDPGRLSPHTTPPYHCPATPQLGRQPHVSSLFLSSSSPALSPAPRTPPSRGRSEERTYAQELHLRSRSPKAFAPRPEEQHLPKHDLTDPAFSLGAFRTSNVRVSRSGDQELPWKITIPGDSDETATNTSFSWRRETEVILNSAGTATGIGEGARTGTGTGTHASTGTRLPTYQEDEEEHGPTNHQPVDEKPSQSRSQSPPLHPLLQQTAAPIVIEPLAEPQSEPQSQSNSNSNPNPIPPEHPHRSGARVINSDAPVELPVTADDNSSEEIMMSSTAYPGQEWRPLGFSEWDHQ